MANKLRIESLQSSTAAGSGHPTSCLSCAELMSCLFFSELKPEDEFILSKGHAAPILWAAYAEAGFISLKVSVFASEVGRRPYRFSICAIVRLPVKPDDKTIERPPLHPSTRRKATKFLSSCRKSLCLGKGIAFGFLVSTGVLMEVRFGELRKRPETTLCFQARITGETLQAAQSYSRTRPK